MRVVMLLSLCLVSCTDGGEGPENTDSCPFSATEVSPPDGSTGVFVSVDYDPVVVTFDQVDVELIVRTTDGDDLVGESTSEGSTSTWVVRGSHGTDTTYEVFGSKDDCEQKVSTFTTGPWSFTDLDGKSFRLDLTDATGPGISPLSTAVDSWDLALWNRDSVNDFWTAVPIEDDEQELCSATTDVQGGFVNGQLFFRLTDVPWVVESDESVRWVNTEVTALVPRADPTTWERVRIQGELDLSPLQSVGADCGAFEAFGDTCGPCSDGRGELCIEIDVTGATA